MDPGVTTRLSTAVGNNQNRQSKMQVPEQLVLDNRVQAVERKEAFCAG
jgi:hypothetical protein